MIDLSIILVNFNTFELTCQCIKSIYSFTKDCRFEIILVDNASEDRPAEAFRALFPEIILIKSESNVGFAKGNNLGIERARGETILLLNTDTVIKQNNDAISLCWKSLQDWPKIGVLTARLEYPDGRHQSNCQRFPGIKYKLYELFRVQKFLPKKIRGRVMLGAFFDHKSRVLADWVWGTFFMFKKEMLMHLKGQKLNDEYFMYAEDMQWCKDFKRMGWKVGFLPDASIIHFMGGSQGGQQLLMQKSYHLFLLKNYSRWERFFIRKLDQLLSQ